MARNDEEMRAFTAWLGTKHQGATVWHVARGGSVIEARYLGSPGGVPMGSDWMGATVNVELVSAPAGGISPAPVPIETLYKTKEEAFAAAPTVIP